MVRYNRVIVEEPHDSLFGISVHYAVQSHFWFDFAVNCTPIHFHIWHNYKNLKLEKTSSLDSKTDIKLTDWFQPLRGLQRHYLLKKSKKENLQKIRDNFLFSLNWPATHSIGPAIS